MAFVLDLNNEFARRANPESIIWQRLDSAHWEGQLRNLIEQHHQMTASKWAQEILDGWDDYRQRFWQICPKEMIERVPVPLSDTAIAAE